MKTCSELKLPKCVFFSQQPVFYRPHKAESCRASHPSEGLSEPLDPSTSSGSSNSWPVARWGKPANKAYCHCSHRGAELICHSRDSWVNTFVSFWCNMELLGSTLVELWCCWGLLTLSLLSPVLLCVKWMCSCPQSTQSSQPISKGQATYFSLEFAHVTCCFILIFCYWAFWQRLNRINFVPGIFL